MSDTSQLSTDEKARLFDMLTERIKVVRERYEWKGKTGTFNSVFSNGVIAGLRVVEEDFDHLMEFEIDKPHPLTDLSHLVDDRSEKQAQP